MLFKAVVHHHVADETVSIIVAYPDRASSIEVPSLGRVVKKLKVEPTFTLAKLSATLYSARFYQTFMMSNNAQASSNDMSQSAPDYYEHACQPHLYPYNSLDSR